MSPPSPRTLLDGQPDRAHASRALATLARRVNGLFRTAVDLDEALAVGRAIFDEVFEGSTSRVHSHGVETPSFRALAHHSLLTVSATKVWYLVRVWMQYTTLPRDLMDALSFTHHRALLGLDDPVVKARLAHESRVGGWSTRRLADAVRASCASARDHDQHLALQLERCGTALGHAAHALHEAAPLLSAGVEPDPRHLRVLGQQLEGVQGALTIVGISVTFSCLRA